MSRTITAMIDVRHDSVLIVWPHEGRIGTIGRDYRYRLKNHDLAHWVENLPEETPKPDDLPLVLIGPGGDFQAELDAGKL